MRTSTADDRAELYRMQGWWPDVTLFERVEGHVERRPHQLAVIDDSGQSLTMQQLWDAAGAFSDRLQARVPPGHVVAIMLPNCVAWQVALLGTLRAGLVPATIPKTTDPGTLRYMLELVSARVIAAARPYDSGAATDADSRADRGSAHWTVDVGGGPFMCEELPEGRVPDVPQLAHIFFTSSTTGRPKAVMHTEQTLAAVHIGFNERFDLDGDAPIFMPSPLGHSVGAWHGSRLALFNGSTLVLQDTWKPERALELAEEHRCRFTAAATPFLNDLVEAPVPSGGTKLASVTTFLCGGAQVPPALLERCRTEFPATFVTVLWGMSEGGVTTCVPGDDWDKVVSTAGRGLPGLELRTVDPAGRELPGERGELVMRGPGVFPGYLAASDPTDALYTDDGFFRTGDQAIIDADGYVTITGRIKDLIVRAGVNISPVPTEDAIFSHPDVVAVAVVGWPDDRLGERICALVQAVRPLDLDDILHWCERAGLARRQWPERVVQVDSVPRTAAGKIRKHQLRDQLMGGHFEESDA